MKQFLCVLLAAILAASVLSACSKAGNDSNNTSSGSGTSTDSTSASGEDVNTNLTEAGTFPIVKERVEISVFTHPTPEKKVDSYKSEDNKFTAWYEEYTNVKLNFIMAPSAADITTSLSTLMSSGEMPDILLSNNFTPEQQQLYGEQGTILEITELVEKNAPRIKKWWDENPEIKDAVTFSGDRTYAINYESTNPRDMVWNKMFVYKPWLDTLNLPIPETTEEFYQTLLAFKNDDPNGNGQKDEIPLIGNISWVAWKPLVYLMDAFEYNEDGTNLFVNASGNVYPAYTQDGYKEGLKWINKLYSEGLIAPETFTMSDMSTYRTVAGQEPNIVGFMPSHAAYTAAEMYADDFVMIPPLKGPDGKQYATKINTISNGGVLISGKTEYPEVCIRIIDGLFEEEVAIRACVGEENKDWTLAEAGAVTADGQPAKYHQVNSGSAYDPDKISPNAVWPMAIYLRGDSVKNSWFEELFDHDPDAAHYNLDLNTWTEDLYLPYLPDSKMLLPVNLVISSDLSAELSDLSTLITETTNSWSMRFILGEANIDDNWEAYLAELESVGLARFLEIYQQAYDQMK